MYNITFGCVSVTIVVVDNNNIPYCDCGYVALGIQHAKRMRHI